MLQYIFNPRTKKFENIFEKNGKNTLKQYVKEYFQKGGEAEPMLNIYDKELQSCEETNMNNGSWDNEGKCSEKDGGVHQICVKNIANNAKEFSKKTGQSNWSDQRGDDNHCVCLGAWSLYNRVNKRNNQVNTKKILKCDAIPKISLTNKYVDKFSEGWNKWNGNEKKPENLNLIIDGVESLVENCYNTENKEDSEALKKNYCNFANQNPVLQNSNLYTELCDS